MCRESEGYPYYMFWCEEADILIEVDQDSIGEFTGLKDKNGKEIYEGDIVNTNNETPFIVKYDNTCCAFLWGDYYFEDRVEERKVKIIGNIYENPELIK